VTKILTFQDYRKNLILGPSHMDKQRRKDVLLHPGSTVIRLSFRKPRWLKFNTFGAGTFSVEKTITL